MKKLRKAETIVLCGILALGFCLVLLVLLSWSLREQGKSSALVSFFSKNAAPDLAWTDILCGQEGKYARRKNAVQKYEAVANGFEGTVENLCTTSIPGSGILKHLADRYRSVLMHSSLSAVTGGKTNREYAKEAAGEVEKFAEYLDGTDFLYMQLPFGARIRGEDAPELEMWDLFTAQMEKSGIDFLNYRVNGVIPLDETGHWMSADALEAAETVAMRLNRDFGWDFDSDVFDPDRYRDVMTPEIASRIREDFGYDYSLLIPADSPAYTVIRNEEDVLEGDFRNTLLYPEWDVRVADGQPGAYHNTYYFRNGDLCTILNHSGTHNDGKRLLVLGDSFSWPIVAYLSQDVQEITILHPRYFRGDVRTYVEQYQPDAVLWIYVEAQVGAFNAETFGIVN